MQPFVRPVFLSHDSARLEAVMRRAIKLPMRLYRVADRDELRSFLQRSSPASLCVIDPFRAGEDLQDLVASFPLVTVVAAFEIQPEDAPLLLTLFGWGVADVLDLSWELTPAAVARRINEVRGWSAQLLLSRALPTSIANRARAMLTVAAEVAADGGQRSDLAESLGISERSVHRWCDRAGLPSARRLLAWLRMLMVAELLDDPNRTVISVAIACGYASGASLNFAVRSFLGMAPSELRKKGAFETVAERFRAELLAHRSQARGLRRRESEWLS